MDRKELQQRTKKFHVDVIKVCEVFPKNAAGFETAKQFIRSAGSVGANYSTSVRAKSPADFVYKIEQQFECLMSDFSMSDIITTSFNQIYYDQERVTG